MNWEHWPRIEVTDHVGRVKVHRVSVPVGVGREYEIEVGTLPELPSGFRWRFGVMHAGVAHVRAVRDFGTNLAQKT